MTIKNRGGVFGRNPTFNNVDVDGTATLDSIASGTKLEIKGSDNPAAYIEFENTFQNAAIVTQAGLLLGVNSTVGTSYAGVIATENSANSNAVFLDLYANNGSGPFLVARARNNKNFEIVDGDLVVASGHGIDFSATAGTGTSELFDDYEEGSWSPTLVGNTSAGTYSIAASSCTYTKVGRLVTVMGKMTITVTSAGSGLAKFGGLPFTTSGDSVAVGTAVSKNVDLDNSTVSLAFQPWTSNTTEFAISSVRDNSTTATLDVSGISTGDFIIINTTYIT